MNLAGQIVKIRRQVRSNPAEPASLKRRPARISS